MIVRRQNVPPALFHHLLDRVQSRKIAPSQQDGSAIWGLLAKRLAADSNPVEAARIKERLLAKRLDGEPEVPESLWHKRFSGMTVCGEGELIAITRSARSQLTSILIGTFSGKGTDQANGIAVDGSTDFFSAWSQSSNPEPADSAVQSGNPTKPSR